MRIAFFTDTFLPQLNGIATSLANQAKALGEEGHQVLIFTPKLDNIKRGKFQAKNVTVVQLPTVPALVYTEFKFGVFGLPQVIKHLTKFKPDILHLQSTFTIGMDAVMAKKIFKKPLVGTVHVYFTDSDYLRFLKYELAVKIVDKVAIRYLNFLYSRCDLLLAPSKKLTDELKINGFKKPIHYLPNGLTLQKPNLLSERQKELLKKKYHLHKKVVLHSGRLSYEKNVDQLIKAFNMLLKNHQDLSLLMIGDGPATKSLQKIVKKLGINHSVTFTGFIEHQDLVSSGILSLGDVFATASTMEVNPMAVLESMAYGLPVVGVKQAGLIELVSKNGYLVKSGDTRELTEKMEKILYDPKLASSMGKESLEVIKNYSIDRTTDQLLHFYQSLLS